MNQILDT